MNKKIQNEISKRTQKFLNKNISEKPFLIRKAYQSLRVFYAVTRDIFDGQFSLRAMSLVYTTLITLVPLIAISFSVLKGLGIHNQIEPMLKQMLAGFGQEQSAEITEKIVSFVDNIQVGVLGVIGLALLIYSVIALMQKIEWAFNAIWRVGQGRSLMRRVSDYLTVLFVGPLALFISTSATTMVRHSSAFEAIKGTFLFAPFAGWLVPWLVLTVGFTALYLLIPNTKVRFYPAFVGGLFAALIWKTMGWGFALFVSNATGYVAIYAAFATLILFMIWVYIGWLVVLIGSNIAFYVQNPQFIKRIATSYVLPPHLIHAYGLGCIYHIGQSHLKRGGQKMTTEALSKKLNAPAIPVERILKVLETSELILSREEEQQTWHPAVSFASTKLQAVYDALECYGADEKSSRQKVNTPDAVAKLMDKVDANRKKLYASKSIEEALQIKSPKKK